jgi:hypothetical protein
MKITFSQKLRDNCLVGRTGSKSTCKAELGRKFGTLSNKMLRNEKLHKFYFCQKLSGT